MQTEPKLFKWVYFRREKQTLKGKETAEDATMESQDLDPSLVLAWLEVVNTS